jgi:hypothetical protein
MKKLLTAASLALLLAACGQQHDVAYYKAHAGERDEKITACRDQSGSFDNNPECISAMLAEEVKPVSYWKENSQARGTKIAECREHAATIGEAPNCENAGRAAAAAMGGGVPVYVPAPKQ